MSKSQLNDSPAAGLQTDCEGSSRRRNWGLFVTAGVGGTLVALYAVATPFVTPALRKICLPFVPATSTQIQNVLKMLENRSGSLVDIGSGDGRIVIAAAKRGFKAVGYELNPWLVWYSRYRAWRDGVHQNAKFYISDLWKVSLSHYTNVVVFGVPQMFTEAGCRDIQGRLQPLHSCKHHGEGVFVSHCRETSAFSRVWKYLLETEYLAEQRFALFWKSSVVSLGFHICSVVVNGGKLDYRSSIKMPQLEKKLEEELECDARIIACRFPFPCWIPDHTTGEGIDTVWAYDLRHSRGCETKILEVTPETKF